MNWPSVVQTLARGPQHLCGPRILSVCRILHKIHCVGHTSRVFLRFRFGDRKEILRDRLEEFERPFSIDVISGHYILRDRWRNLRDCFGPSKHLKKTLHTALLCYTSSKYRSILFTIYDVTRANLG